MVQPDFLLDCLLSQAGDATLSFCTETLACAQLVSLFVLNIVSRCVHVLGDLYLPSGGRARVHRLG